MKKHLFSIILMGIFTAGAFFAFITAAQTQTTVYLPYIPQAHGASPTPQSTSTPAPTSTPQPTFTPAPTSTPEPTPTSDPNAGPVAFGPTFSGDGTYYFEADGSGNCLFDAQPEPQFVAAVNESQYNGFQYEGQTYAPATLCGSYAEVTGPDGTVIVQIVDRCPECLSGDLDLSTEAFDLIAERQLGRVDISWRLLSMPVTDPLVFRYKDGSSAYWTAVQVRNLPHPVVRVEQRRNGQYVELARQQWNYFTNDDGFGTGAAVFRITDIFGNQVIETSKISMDNSTYFPNVVDWTGDYQFPQAD